MTAPPIVRLVHDAAHALDGETASVVEQHLLGALLADGAALSRVAGLRSEHFAEERDRRIFQAIRDQAEEFGAAAIDTVIVAERLGRAGSDGAAVRPLLEALVESTPSSRNIERYAALVIEKWQRRKIAKVGADLAERAAAGDIAELRREMRTRLDAIEAFAEDADVFKSGFWLRDAKITNDIPYVVKGIFGKGQIIVLWGAPGAGKTFIIMEMACAIGAGPRWHGRRTRKGIVLYVAGESARAYIENRFAALKREWPAVAESEVLVVPLALDLLHAQSGDVDRLIETARALARNRGEVVLIVIDTLGVTFGGGNENAPEDMGLYVANILRIRQETGAAVLVIHHSGKDEAKGMRGHTALLGAIDAELAIEGDPAGERILRTGKVREGEAFRDLFAFRLRSVELGVDQDGDSVTSCVIEAKDEAGTKRARRERKTAGLGKHQKAVLRVIEAAGGRMVRTDLAHKLKDEGMPRNRVHDAIAGLLQAGMLIGHSECSPSEVSLP